MLSRGSRFARRLMPIVLFLLAGTTGPSGQQGVPKTGEWRTIGGDLGNTRYSALDQINATNFKDLQVAWRFNTDNLGPGKDFNLEATPIFVNGVLYSTAGNRRGAVALDAATGELLWMYRSPDEQKRQATGEGIGRDLSGRGVGYWTDGKGDDRIFFVTIGYLLVGLDAKTGYPLSSFGKDGIVDLKQDNDQTYDLVAGAVGWNGAPMVARDVVIVGAAHRGGGGVGPGERGHDNARGYIRGFDVRTGKRLWIFHTIPQPGEFGNETWLNDSWSWAAHTGMWIQPAVDAELGIAYLPIESSTNDYYGGERPGSTLFSETLVAVDLQTGKRIWHFQLVHHGLWDFDIPSPPMLVDITVDGKPIKAVVQPSKQGWLYVFDRQTGRPVWPIEERPVPKGNVPGEWYSPTQPHVTKPPNFERQGFLLEEILDLTPELKKEALALAAKHKVGPLFTPPIPQGEDGKLGTLFVPNGANWPGGSFDPETGIMHLFSHTLTRSSGLVNDPKSGTWRGGRTGNLTVQGLSIFRPPWGRITAIDLNKGEIVWQIAHGETADEVKNHPALKGVNIPRTGREGPIGTLTTKTLVISGDGGIFTDASGQRGARLRAYDKATGQEVGDVFIPAPQSGTPMTYLVNGRQYIVVAVGGGSYPAEFIAFRAPAAVKDK